jgi:hypothetical protein
MSSVRDIPKLETEYIATRNLTIETLERRERGRALPGFWLTLVPRIMTSLTPKRRAQHAPSFEASIDRVVQEYPSLATYAFSRI